MLHNTHEKAVKRQIIGNNWITVTQTSTNTSFPFGVKLDTNKIAARFRSPEDAMKYVAENINAIRQEIALTA